MNLPAADTRSTLLLLGLLAGGVLLAPASPGPGPLPLMTCIAAVHAALLAPALRASWTLLVPLVALPALAATAYGHASLVTAIALVTLAAVSGWAGARCGRLYLPTMLLVFLAPFALDYLVREFGAFGSNSWRAASPLAAALDTGWPSAACLVLMLAWPAWALAKRRSA